MCVCLSASGLGLGMQTLHQLEHIVSAIGSLARHCVNGDEAYFTETIIERAIVSYTHFVHTHALTQACTQTHTHAHTSSSTYVPHTFSMGCVGHSSAKRSSLSGAYVRTCMYSTVCCTHLHMYMVSWPSSGKYHQHFTLCSSLLLSFSFAALPLLCCRTICTSTRCNRAQETPSFI